MKKIYLIFLNVLFAACIPIHINSMARFALAKNLYAKACTTLHWYISAWPFVKAGADNLAHMRTEVNEYQEASPEVQTFVHQSLPNLSKDIKIVYDNEEKRGYEAGYNYIRVPQYMAYRPKTWDSNRSFIEKEKESLAQAKWDRSNDPEGKKQFNQWVQKKEARIKELESQLEMSQNSEVGVLQHEERHILKHHYLKRSLFACMVPFITHGFCKFLWPFKPLLGSTGKIFSAYPKRMINGLASIKYAQHQEQEANDAIENNEKILRALVDDLKEKGIESGGVTDIQSYGNKVDAQTVSKFLIPLNRFTRDTLGIDMRDIHHPLHEKTVTRHEQRIANLKKDSENHLQENRPATTERLDRILATF